MAETEEVVGKCVPDQIAPNDLDNSYVFVSDEDDSGKGIHFQEGEQFTTKPNDDISSSSTMNGNEIEFKGEVVEIAGKSDEVLGLGAESNDDIAVANGEKVVGPDAKLSESSMSNVDQFLSGGEAANANNQQTEVVELQPKEAMNQVGDGGVPEMKPMNTDEEKSNLESQDVASTTEDEVKLSEGEVVDVNSEHEVVNVAECDLQDTAEVIDNAERGSLDLEANPVSAKDDEIDADANVVERETRDASFKAEDDEMKLSEGELVENAENENLDMELNPAYTKANIDAEANVERETRDTSVKADDEVKLSEGEVVENAEENLSLESDPVNTKETLFAVANVVEHESQDACLKVEPEVKLSREVVAEHENLDLESNPANTNEEINAAVKIVELESLDTSMKAEDDEVKLLVENAEHENLNLELNSVSANEVINASANVVELESLDTSVNAEEDEVKLSGEVVENGEREILNLELNPVNALVDIDAAPIVVELESQDTSMKAEEEKVQLSGEAVENAECEILNLESNPVNSNEEIDAAAKDVELESLDMSVKAEEDEIKISGEVVENAEHEILNLESNPVNSNEEINASVNVVELESLDTGVKTEEENVKLSGEAVENAEREILNLESNPVNSNEEIDAAANDVELESLEMSVKAEEDKVKLSGEVVENAEREILNLESNPVNSNEEIDASVNVVELESLDTGVKTEEENVKLSGEAVENSEREILNLESNPVNSNEEIDAAANDVELDSLDMSVKAEEDKVKLSGEVVENAEREILNLESNPVNSNEEIDASVTVVDLESLDTGVKTEEEKVKLSGEVVENAEPEVLNLELNDVKANEEIDVAANIVELESLDMSLKAEEDKVKLSGEVVENAEPEVLNLELNDVKANEEIDVAANIVELESLDMSLKAEEDKVKLSGEVVENAEREILNLELNPVNSNEEIDASVNVVELESLDTSVMAEDGEVVANAEREILNLELNDVNGNEEIDVAANVVELESLDMSLKAEEDKVKLSGEVVENAEREILNLESNPVNSNEVELESLDTSVMAEEGEVVENAEREILNLELNDVDTNVAEIDVAANVVELESLDMSLKAEEDKVKLSSEVVENAEREILNLESNLVNANEEIDVSANVELESLDMSLKVEEDKVNLLSEVIAEHEEVPPATSYLTLEPEVGIPIFSAIISSENSSDANKGNNTVNTELEIESVEDKVEQIDAENLVLRDNDDTGNSQDNNTPVAPPRVEEASIKTKRKPFNFLVKVPRFDSESLREQIRLAKINVDEKTKLRDSIQLQIQEKRASTQDHGIAFEYAKGESRNARKLVRSKRIEIDSLQSVINKAKNALSIGDIDRQMYNMEHMIQHETLPLKEEKQLIREIKQLKLLREQLSSNMGSKEEIKQALEQREEVEERLKVLRKDLDFLKGKVVKAEAAALEAQKKYDAENKEVKEIQAQFRAADGVRQAAYVQWQDLKKELSKKSEYFYKYKDDSAVANNCVFSRDTDTLYRLCTNNVEKFMELWNTNDEFRRDYVKFNTRSTVWRLGTLDGRSLGPDEVPPVLPSYVDTRVNRNVSTPAKVDLKSQFPTLEPKHVKVTESVMSDGQSTKNSTEEKKERAANKEPAISVQSNGPDTVSGQDIIINEVSEEPKKSKEEIEAINKAEERERKEAEAKLKEERRLEALVKASEARERKKKQAEKLQMRAELKTIKEAEQKEKEREKRLRKKERKKVTATDVNDTNGSEIAPSSESAAETTSKDVEVKDSSSAAAPKKLRKHWWFGKQSKAKSTIPPPLRNRNKKKLQQWMWVGITSCFILVMFVMGNMGVFSNVHFRRRSPVV